MFHEHLTEDNFLIYAAKYYDNPQCHSTDEFLEDLKRIKYVKKLITRYIEKGDLKERLILNHLIILNNLFGPDHLCKILYLKLSGQFFCVKPFLVLLNILPEKIYNVGEYPLVDTNMIRMDERIIKVLREIKNG